MICRSALPTNRIVVQHSSHLLCHCFVFKLDPAFCEILARVAAFLLSLLAQSRICTTGLLSDRLMPWEPESQHARTVSAYLQARNRACQQNHIAPAAGAAFGVSASGVTVSELRKESANM